MVGQRYADDVASHNRVEEQPKRISVDGPSWNGPAQSRPNLREVGRMEVQLDMQGGEMVRTEAE